MTMLKPKLFLTLVCIESTQESVQWQLLQSNIMIRQSCVTSVRHFSLLRPLSMTFEGNTQGVLGTEEERLKSVFGGRLKGEPPRSTSRFLASSERKDIAGVMVPSRPKEPDNCCMSGCVNCVWELYNDDLKEWKSKRKEAIQAIKDTSLVWPADFDPPLKELPMKNVPKSLQKKKESLDHAKKQSTASLFPKRSSPLPQSVIDAKKRNASKRAASHETVQNDMLENDDGEGWEHVPVFFKAFAEFEKKKQLQREERAKKQAQS